MHPTVKNIKTYEYLLQNQIFPLPDDYIAVGVYHSKESSNYQDAEAYIRQKGLTSIKLLKIDNEFSPENIYKANSCTDTFKKLLENSSGAIFFGGPDIPPTCYGEQTSLLTIITDPYRHYLELSFLFHMLGGSQDTTYVPLLNSKPNYAILGICLGMQSINVATGGTMVQDIPAELYNITTVEDILKLKQNQQHHNYQYEYGTDGDVTPDYYHQISIVEGSPLKLCVSNDTIHPFVISSHHQCIEKLGRSIKVSAWSMDGKVVESITHVSYPNILGVQFHPERTYIYESAEKMKIYPLLPAEKSYLDMFSGDKGESFQRAIWQEFARKLATN